MIKNFIIFLTMIGVSGTVFAQDSDLNDTNSTQPNSNIQTISQIFESPQTLLEQFSIQFGQEVSTVDLLSFSFGMVAYGVFVWHFYRLIARREIVSMTLEKYHTGGKRLTSLIVYFAKYVLIFPLVVTAWFFAYSLFMFFLAPDIDQDFVFLIVISLVVAIRIAAYYKEDLSKDLAKMIPFSLLGIFLVNTTLFTVDQFFDRLDDFIPFVGKIAAFVLFAIGIEAALRILFLVKRKFLPVAETKLKEEIEQTIDKKIEIHVEKMMTQHEKLKDKLEKTEVKMDEKRNRLEEELNRKREELKDRVDRKREKLEEDLDQKRNRLEEELNQKREKLKERVEKKREKLEEKIVKTENKVEETKTKLEKTKKELKDNDTKKDSSDS